MRRALCLLSIALPLATASAAPIFAQANARWYIGTYTNDVLVWDEATEQVVDRIEMSHFIPTGIIVNESKTRLYVTDASAEHVEIVDLAAGRVIDELTLSHDSVRVRIAGFAPTPDDSRAILFVKRYTERSDRYEVEGPFILEYDLSRKQVTDTVPFPDGQERENVGFRYAPDGRTLYFFTDDIIAVDSETYEETARWRISKPLEPGLGRPSFGVFPGTYDDPGVSTSLYRMTDPVQNRRMMGIAHVRLSEQEVDFYTLGESESTRGFTVAPGGERAYALLSEVGRYEFWEFDLVNRSILRRVPFAGRPRMGIQASADGEKLYIHVAGSTIDVYDRATFELLRTVDVDADMTGVAVIPVDGPAN